MHFCLSDRSFRHGHALAIAVIALTGLAAASKAAEPKSWPELEKPAIDKITQLTAKEHSTILFTIADKLIGYSKDGHVQWINEYSDSSTECGWSHPALSHDGLRIAFVEAVTKRGPCRIVIFDTPTQTRLVLIQTTTDPGEISWSWDDSEIVFYDGGISAVSLNTKTRRHLASPPKIAGRQFGFWVWYPMQLLKNGKDLIVELTDDQSHVLRISRDEARILAVGSRPTVSPLFDRIAYQADDGIVAIRPDGTGRTLLTKPPRQLLFFKEEFFGRITWSPDSKRLFFGTIVSEDRHDNLYLLNVETGRRQQFLSGTSITIRGWH